MYLPHKNHKYLIDVIKILNLEKGIDLSAVFCGSDKGYLDKIKSYTNNSLFCLNNPYPPQKATGVYSFF